MSYENNSDTFNDCHIVRAMSLRLKSMDNLVAKRLLGNLQTRQVQRTIRLPHGFPIGDFGNDKLFWLPIGAWLRKKTNKKPGIFTNKKPDLSFERSGR